MKKYLIISSLFLVSCISSQSNRQIAGVFDEDSDEYGFEKALNEYLTEAGYNEICCDNNNKKSEENTFMDYLHGLKDYLYNTPRKRRKHAYIPDKLPPIPLLENQTGTCISHLVSLKGCSLPTKHYGETHTCNCDYGYTGSKTYECSGRTGKWIIKSNTCTSISNKYCKGTAVKIEGAKKCLLQDTIFEGTSGTCYTGYIGDCEYRCVQGKWIKIFNNCQKSQHI